APTPASNILQISFVGRDPVKAARMVNTITDTYIDHHNRVYRNEGVHSFYTEQLRTLEDAMKTAQHRLHDFLRQEKIVDVDQEIHILNQDLVEQDKMLKGHRAKIAGVEQKLQELHRQIRETPEQISFAQEFQTNPVQLTFKTKLAELEIDRAQLLEHYMPSDRHVKDKEEEIARLKQRAKEERDRILQKETMQSNENYRQ